MSKTSSTEPHPLLIKGQPFTHNYYNHIFLYFNGEDVYTDCTSEFDPKTAVHFLTIQKTNNCTQFKVVVNANYKMVNPMTDKTFVLDNMNSNDFQFGKGRIDCCLKHPEFWMEFKP